MTPERRTAFATVLFTDIVGSTDRLAELGNRRWQKLLEEHNARIRRHLRRFGGRELNTAGDAFVAIFGDPASALQCAWAAVAAVRELGLELRCGLHLGQVEGVGSAAGGLAVHVAARIAAKARPAEVLVSGMVRDAVAGAGFAFDERGVHALKGVPGEWRLYSVSSTPSSEAWPQGLARTRRALTQKRLIGAVAVALIAVLASLYPRLSGDRLPGQPGSGQGGVAPLTGSKQPRHSTVAAHRQVTFLGSASDAAISPDGKTVAYVSRSSESAQKLMVQDLAGGEPLEIASSQYILNLRWSPNGSELLYMAWSDSSYGVFLVPRLGGSHRRMRVTNTPSWSPDGSRIVSTDHQKIGFTTTSTNEVTFLSLPAPARPQDIDWSPKGTHLAVLGRQDDRYGIWTTTIDGRDVHRLVLDTLSIYSPRWSPLGDAVYYLRGVGQTQELAKIPVSDSGRAEGPPVILQSGLQVARNQHTNSVVPFTISRDGRRILYTRGLESSNLWVVDREPTGGNPILRQLTNSTAPKWIGSISPDGQTVVFTEGDERTGNVFTASLENDSRRQVTFIGGAGGRPVWSADGRQLAFRAVEGGTHRVWVVDAAGGTPRVFRNTRMSDDFLGFMAWAPGKDLLYQRPGSRNFAVLDPLSETERNLVSNDSVGWMFSPQVAPGGNRIALSWNRSPGPGIWIVSMVDTTQIHLKEGFFSPIGWSPTGDWIYAWKDDERQIVRVPSQGGPTEEVLILPCATPVRWVAMAPGGKRFVCNVLDARYDVWLMENFDPTIEGPLVSVR